MFGSDPRGVVAGLHVRQVQEPTRSEVVRFSLQSGSELLDRLAIASLECRDSSYGYRESMGQGFVPAQAVLDVATPKSDNPE